MTNTIKFKSITNHNGVKNQWYELQYDNEYTIELPASLFPFLEQGMELDIELKVTYDQGRTKQRKGNEFNKNGREYDV